MKRILSLLFAVSICINICGCAPLLIGAVAGGVGVYAVSKDTIQGDTDSPYASIWDAAIKEAKFRGEIKKESFDEGFIEVEANTNKIWIRFERLTQATTRVRVSARKYKLPNIEVAQDVFVRIIENAKIQQ